MTKENEKEEKLTFTDSDGNEVEPDDIAGDCDGMLEEKDLLFVKGSDGMRYLASVHVTFEPTDDPWED